MQRGIIQAALDKVLPLELDYREPSIGDMDLLHEGFAQDKNESFQPHRELRSTELDWLLRLTW